MVARTDRHSGTGYNHRRAGICESKGFLFALQLAQTILANHVSLFEAEFLQRLTVGFRKSEDAFRTGMQHFFGPGAERLVEHVARSHIVHRIEIGPDTRPQVRIGSKMIDLTATTHCFPNALRTANIPAHDFDRIAWQMTHIGSWFLENPHRFTLVDQLLDEVRSNKPASSRNENQGFPPIPTACCNSDRVSRPGERFSSFIVFINSSTALLTGHSMPRARVFKWPLNAAISVRPVPISDVMEQ